MSRAERAEMGPDTAESPGHPAVGRELLRDHQADKGRTWERNAACRSEDSRRLRFYGLIDFKRNVWSLN